MDTPTVETPAVGSIPNHNRPTVRRKRFLYNNLNPKQKILAYALTFGIVGVALLAYSRAASPLVAFEPENATLTAGATVGTDTTASGGKYVQFGSAPTTPPATGFFPRGMYETSDGTRDDLFKSLGFNLSNVGANASLLDTLAAKNMKGMVWLGGYDSATCSMGMTDAQVTTAVNAVKAKSNVYGYYLIDEPENLLYDCPVVVNQVAARAQLVKSLDPNHITYAVVSNSAYVKNASGAKVVEMSPYHYFTTVDMIGFDIYPCRQPAGSTCNFGEIDDAIAAANAQGVKRYLAVVQDFEDTIWRRPTTAELKTQFDHWDNSRMEGYTVFSWDWQGNTLDGNTDHYTMLQTQNARAF